MSKMYFLPLRPAFDSAGVTVPGSQHWFTLAGTNTPSAPFTDATLTTRLENPIIANGVGYLPPVYLDETVSYRVRVYLPNAEVGVDTPTEEYDPYTPAIALLTYLGDSGFDGLLKDAASLIVPTGTDAVGTTGADALDHGAAIYVAGTKPTTRSGFASANARNFVLSKEQIIVPQMFYQATDPDAQNMFEGARDYLKTQAYNYGNHYGGSQKLVVPAGPVYDLHGALDFNHSLIIEGEGSGQQGVGAYGVSRLRWTAGSNGIRNQFPNTSGNTTVDGAFHDGSGGLVIKGLCLQGGYAGTEGDFHGLVVRKTVFADDLYIIGWQGEGVKAWAGTVTGFGVVSGDASCSRFNGIKVESCRGGFDIRGTDANVIATIACQGYTNRWFGYLDDNGAGSNAVYNFHAAGNGLYGPIHTQCHASGKYYAVKWGQETWCSTNAPSGTTAHNTGWLFSGTGAPDTEHPDWVTGQTWRAGGDYFAINTAGVDFNTCYSEGNNFSQFLSANVELRGGTIADVNYYGGRRLRVENDGYAIRSNANGASNTLHVDCDEGAFSAIDFRQSLHGGANSPLGILTFTPGYSSFAGSAGGIFLQTLSVGVSTNRARLDTGGFKVVSGTLGYDTGTGAAVTQLTSKSTATPAINKGCGQVTMNNAALAAGAKVSFVVTNNTVAATDTIIVSVASGGTANAYRASVTAISAGASFTVTVENITAGSLSEAPVINFAILTAVAA